MKSYLFLLILPCSFCLAAQQNYIDFHLRFYKVEDLIAQEKFVEAEDLMLDLFVDFEPKFAKDFLVAAQVCAINKSDYLAIEFLKKAMLMGVKNGDLSPSQFIEIYFWQDKMIEGVHHDAFFKNIRKKEVDFSDYHFYKSHSPETTPEKIKADRARFGARPSGLKNRLKGIEKKYGMQLVFHWY